MVKLGSENGVKFGDGLLRAADVEGDELNLSKQLGGDRPTALAVVCALMGSLRVLDLSSNKLGPEGGASIVEALKFNDSLTSLDLKYNDFDEDSKSKLRGAVQGRSSFNLVL